MLSDLDPLMHARGLSALIVPLHESMHSSFRWMARGAKLTKGYAIKIVERDPVLVAYPMERDEAAASGLTARGVHDFGFDKIFRTAANPVAAYGEFFDNVLRDLSGAPPPSAGELDQIFAARSDAPAAAAQRVESLCRSSRELTP